MYDPTERDRADEVSTALQGILQEGEGFLVRCHNFSIEVVPFNENEPFDLKNTHEELYGCLLSVDEELSSAGTTLIWILGVFITFFCLALHLQWVDVLFGYSIDKVRSLWFYLASTMTVFVIYGIVVSLIENWIYQNRRGELLQAIFEAGISRYSLLARMEGDPSVSSVAEKLKTDRSSGKLPL